MFVTCVHNSPRMMISVGARENSGTQAGLPQALTLPCHYDWEERMKSHAWNGSPALERGHSHFCEDAFSHRLITCPQLGSNSSLWKILSISSGLLSQELTVISCLACTHCVTRCCRYNVSPSSQTALSVVSKGILILQKSKQIQKN